MTKAEIINQIAEQTGVAKKDVATTVEAFMETIRISLAENKEAVYLRGFGTFGIKHRANKLFFLVGFHGPSPLTTGVYA